MVSTDPARERQRARDRLRSVTPLNAAKILTHNRYWTPQFFELYVARCDETAIDEPVEAYQLARHLPEMARRIRVGSAFTDWDTPEEKLAGLVLALAVLGTCCYAINELEESALCFSRAFRGLGKHRVEPNTAAELRRRHAVLHSLQGDLSAARTTLEKASALATAPPILADCLALETFAYSDIDPAHVLLAGIRSYPLADLKSACGCLAADVAFFNSMAAVSFGSIPLRTQAEGLTLVKKAKDAFKGTPNSIRKTRLLWLEGLLLFGIHFSVHAERQLRKAHDRLSHLPLDHALVSLDLICLLVSEGDYDAATAIATGLKSHSASTFAPSEQRILNRWCAGSFTTPDQEARVLKERLLGFRIPAPHLNAPADGSLCLHGTLPNQEH